MREEKIIHGIDASTNVMGYGEPRAGGNKAEELHKGLIKKRKKVERSKKVKKGIEKK